jgi:hypothetical protein
MHDDLKLEQKPEFAASAVVDPKALRIAEVFMTLAQRGSTLAECLKIIRVIVDEPVRRKRRPKGASPD